MALPAGVFSFVVSVESAAAVQPVRSSGAANAVCGGGRTLSSSASAAPRTCADAGCATRSMAASRVHAAADDRHAAAVDDVIRRGKDLRAVMVAAGCCDPLGRPLCVCSRQPALNSRCPDTAPAEQ